MRILGISGSLRPSNNSQLLLKRLFETFPSGVSAEQVQLDTSKITCFGCERCYEDSFAHEDQLGEVYRKFLAADVLVLSSPTHFGLPSVLIKTFMDRSNGLWLQQAFRGKRGAIVVNGAGRFGGIELCAKTIAHYFYDCEMVALPFFMMVNNTRELAGERLSSELPDDIIAGLTKLGALICAPRV